MNPFLFPNYLYTHTQPNYAYTWMPQYNPQLENMYRILLNSPNPYTADQNMGPLQKNTSLTQAQVVKVQETANLMQINRAVNPAGKVKRKYKSQKNTTGNDQATKQSTIKLQQVKTKVKYFDPSSCPLITSAPYNLVEDLTKQLQHEQKIAQCTQNSVNELEFPEEDQQPFIVYRFRRIKKKYKMHLFYQNKKRSNLKVSEECNVDSSDVIHTNIKNQSSQLSKQELNEEINEDMIPSTQLKTKLVGQRNRGSCCQMQKSQEDCLGDNEQIKDKANTQNMTGKMEQINIKQNKN